jgi:hypothetical protein
MGAMWNAYKGEQRVKVGKWYFTRRHRCNLAREGYPERKHTKEAGIRWFIGGWIGNRGRAVVSRVDVVENALLCSASEVRLSFAEPSPPDTVSRCLALKQGRL